jgi:hypothetical protein
VGSCLAFHAGSSEGANSVVVWVGVSVAAVVDVGVGRVRVVAVAAVARAGLAGASLLRISRRSIRPLGQAFGSDLYLEGTRRMQCTLHSCSSHQSIVQDPPPDQRNQRRPRHWYTGPRC